MSNKNELIELTVEVPDIPLSEGFILINPRNVDFGMVNLLKKYKIISKVTTVLNYKNIMIPVAKVNMGKLKDFDAKGIREFKEKNNSGLVVM